MDQDEHGEEGCGGNVFGCLAAFLLAGSAGFILFFAMAWSGAHCSPLPQCRRDGVWLFLEGAFVLSTVCALTWFIVRSGAAVVSRDFARKPVAMFAINLTLVGVVVWLALEIVMKILIP